MPSRFDDDCYGTNKKGESLMPPDLIVPTSAGEQFRSGGWMNSDKPVGGTPPGSPEYPLSGNAGMDTDNDADDQINIAAIMLRDTQP